MHMIMLNLAALKDKKALKGSKKLFYAWIVYQAVKGTLTTAFIWIPMLYLWLEN